MNIENETGVLIVRDLKTTLDEYRSYKIGGRHLNDSRIFQPYETDVNSKVFLT